ncbi:hypothetical protein AXF42_Ash021681 [Apostasia shenzhenica]|uniref:Uncharacterized protein n=1 Tax=Apostasia shenzhenica TaxID=1088818 RepID=A0A2H9ZX88_9ASPA|nr:hypothetical protein AXF42_Ash021681 [Apostasia shenzhenica]
MASAVHRLLLLAILLCASTAATRCAPTAGLPALPTFHNDNLMLFPLVLGSSDPLRRKLATTAWALYDVMKIPHHVPLMFKHIEMAQVMLGVFTSPTGAMIAFSCKVVQEELNLIMLFAARKIQPHVVIVPGSFRAFNINN